MSDEVKLNVCRKCGAVAHLRRDEDYYYVICDEDYCSNSPKGYFDTPPEAIEAWQKENPAAEAKEAILGKEGDETMTPDDIIFPAKQSPESYGQVGAQSSALSKDDKLIRACEMGIDAYAQIESLKQQLTREQQKLAEVQGKLIETGMENARLTVKVADLITQLNLSREQNQILDGALTMSQARVKELENRQWPDIGLDPLKHRDEVDGSPEASMKRMNKACTVQQKEVPDQTALVWRIDIDRVNCDLIVAKARAKQFLDTCEENQSLRQQLKELGEAASNFYNRMEGRLHHRDIGLVDQLQSALSTLPTQPKDERGER